jgi:hypothetical protein
MFSVTSSLISVTKDLSHAFLTTRARTKPLCLGNRELNALSHKARHKRALTLKPEPHEQQDFPREVGEWNPLERELQTTTLSLPFAD